MTGLPNTPSAWRPTATDTACEAGIRMKHRQLSLEFLLFCGCVAAGGLSSAATAQTPPGGAAASSAIFSCTTPDGRKLTSDRPIPDCAAREQRVLNKDGSLRRVHPPLMSPEERADREASERKLALERSAAQDAMRRDRNLATRFPNAAAHQKAREAALDTVRSAMNNSESRMRELTAERKPLLNEAEFYKGKQLPAKLRQQLDAVDAAAEAQRGAIANQEIELVRINKLYDLELERLKKLWAGTPPGSLGPMPAVAAPPAAATVAASAKSDRKP